jgi:hypothetical protein
MLSCVQKFSLAMKKELNEFGNVPIRLNEGSLRVRAVLVVRLGMGIW